MSLVGKKGREERLPLNNTTCQRYEMVSALRFSYHFEFLFGFKNFINYLPFDMHSLLNAKRNVTRIYIKLQINSSGSNTLYKYKSYTKNSVLSDHLIT